MLEITTTNQVHLASNRVALRNFVASFIDQANASAVLAVFHQPDCSDWRLTFAARKTTLDQDTFEITTIETAPRRFTFLLGENESCRTAAGRLGLLREKQDDLSLADLEKAFSVETLSKEFFKKYKEHYQLFVHHLLSTELAGETRELFEIPTLANEAEQEKADKPVRDFVKTLLGRLVFLHFLQKKGWLGCPPKGKKWQGGDPDFLQSFLQLATDQKEEDLFHSKYLTALFFEALNREESASDLFALTGTRLPYLNGGLFEDDDDHARGIDFPPQLFQNLLDFFGEYNFTIDENDPEDHEVGIDPEMLGMIFENLLEDNKEKGTYYTPKAIVSYMARQSLLHYLQTHLGEHEDLEKLLNEKNSEELPPFVAKNKEDIDDLLAKVTICDPAIGSGAFPIGLLHEILWTRLTLYPEKNDPKQRAELKRSIIQDSIHGVDIDPGAIEIARLRFWLTLVVDEDKPRPLPNLDYKIHRADSLIEYIRGEPVNLGTETPKDGETKRAVAALAQAKQDLFTAQGLPGKRKAWFQLYRALAQLGQAEFTWMRNQEGLFAEGERVAQLDQNAHILGQWLKKIDSVQKAKVHFQESLLAELRSRFDDIKNPTFLWNLHFGGIFAEGGFDIVIANPPYLTHDHLEEKHRSYFPNRFAAWNSFADFYCYFIELAKLLIKPSGISCSLTSNSFLRADYGKNLRATIEENCSIKEIFSIEGLQVFDTAIVNVAILTFSGQKSATPFVTCRDSPTSKDIYGHVSEKSFPTSQRELARNIWSLSTEDEFALVNRIEGNHPTPESQKFKIRLGIATGSNKAFVISPEQQKSFTVLDSKNGNILKPIIRGRNVERFKIPEPQEYLILSKNGIDLPNDYPDLSEHLESFGEKFKNRGAQGQNWWNLRACSFYDDFEKPRIVWIELTDQPRFALCKAGVYLLNTAYFMLPADSDDSPFLVSLFNSKTIEFFVQKNAQTSGMGTTRWFKEYVTTIPIPSTTKAEKIKLASLAEKCATATAEGKQASLAAHEAEINAIVYRFFDLTEEEIALIESTLET